MRGHIGDIDLKTKSYYIQQAFFLRSFFSKFTMSKGDKNVNQMCSSNTKVQRRPITFCEGTIQRKLAILLSTDEKLLPAITYPDIVNYLLLTPSPYTSDNLKSYKGLHAYNQICCGCVRDRHARKFGDQCLVKCKVCIIYASDVDLYI